MNSPASWQVAVFWACTRPAFTDAVMEASLDRAFERDFEELGPSPFRMIRTQFQGYKTTAGWDHELVQMRRVATKKRMLIHIPVLSAMALDLKRMGHPIAEQVRQLRGELIEECGWTGRASAVALSPYIYARLLMEKRRYFKALERRLAIEPRCLLTHYGQFAHSYPSVLPAVDPTPGSVTVSGFVSGAQRHERGKEEMAVAGQDPPRCVRPRRLCA